MDKTVYTVFSLLVWSQEIVSWQSKPIDVESYLRRNALPRMRVVVVGLWEQKEAQAYYGA